MTSFETGSKLDQTLEAVPNVPAVFLVTVREGQPYLAKTGALRRRLKRLLGARTGPSRMLHLRDIAVRVDYWITASRLSSSLIFYEKAREHFPQDYERLVKFRWPSYVKLLLANEFPRTQVTTRVAASGLLCGPFRSRAVAEEFEQGMLEFFQIRRCQDDLAPSPEHPGCIYGEMNRCMRPCQQATSVSEYANEAERVRVFLETGGASLLHTITSARDRLSEELNFEEAARQQQRLTRLDQVLRLKEELAGEVDELSGVAVLPSPAVGCVELRFLLGGSWQPPVELSTIPTAAAMVPLDKRLKELTNQLKTAKQSAKSRQEHLALLARWYFSSWRDGEWLPFETLDKIPYRRLVNAVARQAKRVES